MEQKPILDITTLIERPQIRIDGKLYELFMRDEMSIFTAEKLRRLYNAITALEQPKKRSKAQEAHYLKLLREFVGLVVIALPTSVRAKLRRTHLVSIVYAFFQRPLVATAAPAETKAAKAPKK